MKKNVTNHILVVMLIVIVSAFFGRMMSEGSIVAYAFSIILILLLLFNVWVRNMYTFKPYFLSKWNVLSSKFSKEFEFDIPIELAFDKILEIVAESHFHLKYVNKTDFEIFATSEFSWKSWGENIYIKLNGSGTRTIVRFNSASLFQVYAWGKNEDNFDEFFQKLDDSLTV